jgi:NTP pyrophosphatase (non-canonical NTP hydrolase)
MLKTLGTQFEKAWAGYASANGFECDADWFMLKMHEEIGELTQVWNRLRGRARRSGASDAELQTALADETADLLGCVLLFADQNGLDLASAIERKWRFRPYGEDGTGD